MNGKKMGLGLAGLMMLGLLWGKVRAAQGGGQVVTPMGLARMAELKAAQGMISGAADSMSAAALSPLSAMRGNAALMQSPVRRIVAGVAPKVVRSASIQFEVKSQEQARGRALAAAAGLGAQVTQDDSYESGGSKSGTLAFRVAPEKLDALLRELAPLGRVLHRSVSAQNMTEEYVDLQARLANMRKVEKRLNDLLSFNTHKLGDVLQVERELERVGAEIERLLGRVKYIDALAAESTLTVTISEPNRETSTAPGVFTRVGNSIMRACNTFLVTGLTLLDLTGFLVAVGLWAAPLAWLAWRRLAVKPRD